MNQRRVSEQLVRLVQIIFGFVLAQSLGRYADVVTNPISYDHRIALLALVGVYFTTVMSWIDWHPTMEANPYNMSSKNPHRRTEVLRVWFDLGVVTAYAYLLFSIEPFKNDPHGDVGLHLMGYPVVFMLYLASGALRRRAYGKFASYLSSIFWFGVLFAGLAVAYNSVNWSTVDLPWVSDEAVWGNVVGLGSALGLMLLYRFSRARLRSRRNKRKEEGLKVGFDVDGVLGNQISGVIPRIKRRHGIDLNYSDVTHWRVPIGDSSIDVEILAAMDDADYILRMPVHPGARQTLEELFEQNQILVLTARPEGTAESTEQWLMNNALPYDRIFNVKEQKKSLYATDVLVDDYLENIREYLRNTNGLAVLIDQPWNGDRDEEILTWIDEQRLLVLQSLKEVPQVIEEEWKRIRA